MENLIFPLNFPSWFAQAARPGVHAPAITLVLHVSYILLWKLIYHKVHMTIS